jgi:hypothetical protein
MGILSWIAGPGGWIGDAIKTALTGPLVQGAVDAYKSKLAAGNDQARIAADLGARELAVQQNIADEGRWWTAAPRAIACWAFAIFIAKCVVWDKVLGLGSTDPLTGSLDTWAGWLMALWFGGRSAEKVARIIARR